MSRIAGWRFCGDHFCAVINDAKRGSATECRYYLRTAEFISTLLLAGGGQIIEVYELCD